MVIESIGNLRAAYTTQKTYQDILEPLLLELGNKSTVEAARAKHSRPHQSKGDKRYIGGKKDGGEVPIGLGEWFGQGLTVECSQFPANHITQVPRDHEKESGDLLRFENESSWARVRWFRCREEVGENFFVPVTESLLKVDLDIIDGYKFLESMGFQFRIRPPHESTSGLFALFHNVESLQAHFEGVAFLGTVQK